MMTTRRYIIYVIKHIFICVHILALNSSEEIGSCGGRNFVLYKKNNDQIPEARSSRMITRQHSGRWKACIVCIAQ